MEVKPGHKPSEVGVIPEEWECARMSEIAKLESGHTPSKREPSYWGGSIPWVSLFDTEGLQGREISETAKMVTEEGLNNSSARLLPKGTVVFSRTATVGKTTVMGRDMATSQDFANYICGPKLHNYFLVYLFRSMGRTWKSLMAGSIHNTIYMPVFKALQIVLPPFHEQRAIATALNDVDGLLGGLDRLIAKKRDIKQAAMQQLLTAQTRLPGFHGEWEETTLGHIGKFKNGLNKDSSAFGHGSPFVNLMDVFGVNAISSTSHLGLVASTKMDREVYDLRQGDVLFIRSSVKPSGVGLTAVVERDLTDTVYSGFLIRFRDEGASTAASKSTASTRRSSAKRSSPPVP